MESTATSLEPSSPNLALGKASRSSSLRKRLMLGAYRIFCKIYMLFSRDRRYKQAVPLALYAPWNIDTAFQKTYRTILPTRWLINTAVLNSGH